MKGRNIVLICLDSVRKDVFDEFASQLRSRSDCSYEQCRAASSWSVPSHASILTGLLPSQHGVHTHKKSYEDISKEETFLSDIPNSFETIGISANVFAGPSYGFDKFFNEFIDAPRYQFYADAVNATAFFHNTDARGARLYIEYLKACINDDKPIKSLLNGVATQIQSTTSAIGIPNPMDDGARLIAREATKQLTSQSTPKFMFINFMDAHTPYEYIWGLDRDHLSGPITWTSQGESVWEIQENPEKYRTHLQYRHEFYEASVEYLDNIVNDMIDEIQSQTNRPTTFIITADHGENMGDPAEDYLIDHKSSLSESLLHVPLEIINLPKESQNITNDELISHLQLGDIITAIAHDESIQRIQSEPVMAELIGMGAGEDPPSEKEYWDRAIRCVYEDEKKYQYDSLGNEETYRFDPDNHCCQELVVSSIPENISASFNDGLKEVKQRAIAAGKSREIDEATKSRLRELGYV
ncbi:sulfatase-like hydrolase/transferase [Haladaptatus sp. T7]|uniref:sulfatase-like hydrolase/transferase n=1 Tax=Haladaptatus sp. T7 TaxID=2029368 RepID=UPI0021A2596D|nr:sulfatase-like hydrolase/transferase [Haladaptatus sp. T7]GKZ14546.1 hypothetical protein HAL_24270 [Haladaptatus sp. T7]